MPVLSHETIADSLPLLLRRQRPLWRFLSALCPAVEKAGGKTYLVGGTVRDVLEKRPGKDIDLMVTGIPFPSLGGILRSLPAKRLGIRRVLTAGKAFAVYKVRTSWSGREIDMALARSERSTGAGHRDFDVRTEGIDAREDAGRRDFTINSLLFALRTEKGRLAGEVVDHFGGLRDLREKRIHCVGNPDERFREDPLRMLRAIRQKNERHGYSIKAETWRAIRRAAPDLLGTIAPERVAAELLRSLSSNPAGTLDDLHRSGILRLLLPEAGEGERRIVSGMKRRCAVLARLEGNPLPPDLLFANLLVDIAEVECSGLLRELSPGISSGRKVSARGTLDRKWFRLPATEAAARRLRVPRVRRVIRLVEDSVRLSHAGLLRNRHAQTEAIFMRWEDPGFLLSLYTASRSAKGEKPVSFRSFLRKSASRQPLLSGDDLPALKIPEGPIREKVLEEVREATLTRKVVDKAGARTLARKIGRSGATTAYPPDPEQA